jgi:serine/threonine-protein kinase
MGVVYEAHDRALDEEVAVKVLGGGAEESPERARRFRSEIKLARKVSHRNVCRIHEYGEDGRIRYISMELIRGTNLKERIQQQGALLVREGYGVALQIAEGLAAIHDVGIVHRDLKPSNLMLDTRGTVRVMDFGIAKAVGLVATADATATGQILGSLEYMSPEQVQGKVVDCRSDLYSLGVVLFELFTGRVPFRGDTPIATILKHLQDPPPLYGAEATGLPAGLIPILKRALAKSPDDRYAGIAELAANLREAHRAYLAEALTPTATLWPPRPSRDAVAIPSSPHVGALAGAKTRAGSLRLPLALGAVALAIGVPAVYWLLSGRSLPRSAPETATAKAPAVIATTAPSTIGAGVSPPPVAAGRAAPPVKASSVARPAPPAPRLDAESGEAPPSQEIELPVGTNLIVGIMDEIRSDRSRPGQHFQASLQEPVVLEGHEIAPAGTLLQGRIESAGSYREEGAARPFLELSLTRMELGGKPIEIRTALYRLVGPLPADRSSDTRAVIIGAAAGALVGAALGGKKGAAIGAAGGAAAGTAVSQPAAGPHEYTFGNRLTFKLAESLRLEPPRRSSGEGVWQ